MKQYSSSHRDTTRQPPPHETDQGTCTECPQLHNTPLCGTTILMCSLVPSLPPQLSSLAVRITRRRPCEILLCDVCHRLVLFVLQAKISGEEDWDTRLTYVRTCTSDRQAITMATITMVTYLPTYLPTLVAVALLPAEVRQLTVHLGQECHSRLGSHPQSPERGGGGRGGTES